MKITNDRTFIRNSGIFPQLRGDKLNELVRNGEADLPFVLSFMQDREGYIRSTVARCLGAMGGREVYPYLLELMCDGDLYVRCDSILALGETGDSRSTFPLFNYFRHAPYEEQKRVLLALQGLKDPRAACFLQQHIELDNDIGDLARRAHMDCLGNTDFRYSFAGREDMWKDSRSMEGRILINSAQDLDRNFDVLEKHSKENRPQTYIVDECGKLAIGGSLDEHVDVAKGDLVLAAGEITFSKKGNVWKAEYLNNRSNGYYPDGSSFVHVKKALESGGINCGDSFTEVFPREGFYDPEFLQFQSFYGGIGLEHIK